MDYFEDNSFISWPLVLVSAHGLLVK